MKNSNNIVTIKLVDNSTRDINFTVTEITKLNDKMSAVRLNKDAFDVIVGTGGITKAWYDDNGVDTKGNEVREYNFGGKSILVQNDPKTANNITKIFMSTKDAKSIFVAKAVAPKYVKAKRKVYSFCFLG